MPVGNESPFLGVFRQVYRLTKPIGTPLAYKRLTPQSPFSLPLVFPSMGMGFWQLRNVLMASQRNLKPDKSKKRDVDDDRPWELSR